MSKDLEQRIVGEIDRIDALIASDVLPLSPETRSAFTERRAELSLLLTKTRTPERPLPDTALLISLCEAGVVQQDQWSNRDTHSAQIQLGEAWALLKAGCEWWLDTDDDPTRNDTYRVRIEHKAFRTFEEDHDYRDVTYAYIPTSYALAQANGRDWY